MSCSQDSPHDYRFYPEHLANVLETEAPPQAPHYQPTPPPPWPKIKASETQIGVIDFVSLTGCAVQKVIGEKNSNLGKHAPNSQQLLNTLDFLSLAPACFDSTGTNNAKAIEKLKTAYTQKRQELPLLIGLATLHSKEFGHAWINPTPETYPLNTNSNAPLALEYIGSQTQKWMRGDYSYDSKAFEEALYYIKHSDLGAIYKELKATHWALEEANKAIQYRLETKPLCYKQQRNERFSFFNNVMQKDFISTLQVQNSAAQKRFNALFSPLDELEKQLSEFESENYKSWRKERDKSLEVWLAAPKDHVEKIKALWQQCGHSH